MSDEQVLYPEVVNASGFGDAQSRKLYDAIVGVTNKLFPNKQGQVFTLALTSAGLVKNPVTFNNYYFQNSQVIDGYFNEVDMDALGNAIGGTVSEGISNQLPGVMTGIAIGAGSFIVLRLLKVI